MEEIAAWLKGFVPASNNAGTREKIVGCIGAWLGLIFTAWMSKLSLGEVNPWFIAPMGASAVLLFAVPSSPLAQPWSIIGGNLVSALIGVTCVHWIDNTVLAASLAVACSIGAMLALRCLHPPGSAIAMTAVLGSPAIIESGYHFVWQPVAVNSAFLLLSALVFNKVLRRRYPHPAVHAKNVHNTADQSPIERLGFVRADLDAALKEHREILDISEDDLEEIFLKAEERAFQRHTGGIRCEHVMSRDIVVAKKDMSVPAVRALLARHKIHALPVVDDAGVLVGILTLHDLFEDWERLPPDAVAPRLKLVDSVESIMTRKVRTVAAEMPVFSLIPIFLAEGYHHLPVVDAKGHVVGMVTQSDLVAALYRASIEERPQARVFRPA